MVMMVARRRAPVMMVVVILRHFQVACRRVGQLRVISL
jgi:hypothetical protein